MAERRMPEQAFERTFFAFRWILAPLYVGLMIVLGIVVVVFVRELAAVIPTTMTMTSQDAIIMALTLIDLALIANLVLIVAFSGYENSISRLEAGTGGDLVWMGSVDFSGLKMKLIASIVAISAIALLKRFMEVAEGDEALSLGDAELFWLTIVHVAFVVSALLMAAMDWMGARAGRKPFRDAPRGRAAGTPEGAPAATDGP